MCFEYRLFYVSYPLSSIILITAMCFISIVTDLSEHGWSKEQGCLQVVWDSPENLQTVQRTVDFLTQGCQCKTRCTTQRCKCKKEGMQCGPSCHCINCRDTNCIQQQSEREHKTDQEVLEEMKAQDDISDDLETTEDEHERLDREVYSMMEDIFGVPFNIMSYKPV